MAEKLSMREHFESTGRSITSYARAHGLSRFSLSNVLDGVYTGRRRDKHVVRVIEQLHKDGIWTEPLPWDDASAAS